MSARPGPCGGQSAMVVPTAINSYTNAAASTFTPVLPPGTDGGSRLSDSQYEYAAVAAACAANVPGVAARSLHKHIQVSWTRDQTARNWDLQLLTADNRGAQGLPVDDNDKRRNKLAAHYDEHSTLLHLGKIHRTITSFS